MGVVGRRRLAQREQGLDIFRQGMASQGLGCSPLHECIHIPKAGDRQRMQILRKQRPLRKYLHDVHADAALAVFSGRLERLAVQSVQPLQHPEAVHSLKSRCMRLHDGTHRRNYFGPAFDELAGRFHAHDHVRMLEVIH